MLRRAGRYTKIFSCGSLAGLPAVSRCVCALQVQCGFLGDRSPSGCSCLFWARFMFGFDRNRVQLGYARREAETSPRSA